MSRVTGFVTNMPSTAPPSLMMPVGSRTALFCTLSAEATIKQHKQLSRKLTYCLTTIETRRKRESHSVVSHNYLNRRTADTAHPAAAQPCYHCRHKTVTLLKKKLISSCLH